MRRGHQRAPAPYCPCTAAGGPARARGGYLSLTVAHLPNSPPTACPPTPPLPAVGQHAASSSSGAASAETRACRPAGWAPWPEPAPPVWPVPPPAGEGARVSVPCELHTQLGPHDSRGPREPSLLLLQCLYHCSVRNPRREGPQASSTHSATPSGSVTLSRHLPVSWPQACIPGPLRILQLRVAR